MIVIIMPFLISCSPEQKEQITNQEALKILNDLMTTVVETDTLLAEQILHPECVLKYPALPEPIKGIDEYKKFLLFTSQVFSDFTATVNEINVKDDRIWCRYTMSAKNSGDLGEISATGKTWKVTGMAITKILDGKIVEDETYWNVLSYYQQLGFSLVPPNPEN